MKKLGLLLASMLLVVSLAACGKEELTGEFTWDLPEGFVESATEDNITYYTSEAGSSANINKTIMENDGSLKNVSADDFATAIKDEYAAQGYEIELTIVNESDADIDGRNAFTYEMTYDLMGVGVHQIQTIVEDGDQYIFLTFSWFDMEEGFEELMRASAASIRFE